MDLVEGHLGVVVAGDEDERVALSDHAGEAAEDLGVIFEDGARDGGGVLGGAREIVRDALAAGDARRVEVEDVAVEHEGELVAAHTREELVEHLGDLGGRRVRLLAVPHPEPVRGLHLAQVNIGDRDQMPHGTTMI